MAVPKRTTFALFLLIPTLILGFLMTSREADAAAAGLLDPSRLAVHEGSFTVTQDGAVIEDLEIRGTLRIKAHDVIVRNVWVYTASFWTIYVEAGSATFEHLEVGHPDHVGERGIGGSNIVGRYLDIHHVEDGIKLGRNVLYEYVRVHDLDSRRSSPHADAVQDDGGSQNAVVRNSTLDSTGPLGNGNAAVIIKSDMGASDNITFTGNYLNGGNYVVYVRDGGHGMPTNVSFTNNRIGPDRTYGLLSTDGPIVWTGNVWADTGLPADPENTQPSSTTSSTATSSTTTSTTSATVPQTTAAPAAAAPTTTVAKPAASSTTAALIPGEASSGPSTISPVEPGNGDRSTYITAIEEMARDDVPSAERMGQPHLPHAADSLSPIRESVGSVSTHQDSSRLPLVLLSALELFVLGSYLYVRRTRIADRVSIDL